MGRSLLRVKMYIKATGNCESPVSFSPSLNMETTTTTQMSANDQPEGNASRQLGATPVTFKSLACLPDCQGIEPDESLKLKHTHLVYYNPTFLNNGRYEFVVADDPDRNITLYQSSMRTLVKKLELAFTAAKSLAANPQFHDDDNVYEVCTINKYSTITTKLVLATNQGEVHILLMLYTTNEQNETYPTRKYARFSTDDDLAQLAAFVKGKK